MSFGQIFGDILYWKAPYFCNNLQGKVLCSFKGADYVLKYCVTVTDFVSLLILIFDIE